MGVSVDRGASTRPLELLGISAMEERVYRMLLERHQATAADLAGRLKVGQRMARKLLADLEELGLATHQPGVPRIYVASPPEFAVAALVKKRQAMLERARVAIPGLEEQSARASHANGHEPVLEFITGPEHMDAVLTQMYKAFRSDLMCFQRAPVLAANGLPPHKWRPDMQVRTITDNSLLEIPGTLEQIRRHVARGELARMVPSLPFKMMVFDRRAAIIAVDGERTDHALALLIHGKALLQALCLLFEFVWERATPIKFGRARNGAEAPRDADAGAEALMGALFPLLAAGLNDKAIALELGISPATLNRRMSELMRTSGTRTRFQLGWHAALTTAPTRQMESPATD